MSISAILFVCAVAGLAYVYLGYPAGIWILARMAPRPVRREPIEPSVTLLIAAHNEESSIARTIENKLALDYPATRLELVVVSDGSTDRTEAIVTDYAERGVRLIRQEPRQGKTAALNRGISETRGEIVAFSDANSIWEPSALRQLVRPFADPQVGYVTGKMVYTNPAGAVVGDGCTAYMRYENWLRQAETNAGSIVGVDGGIDAVRRSLYRPMRADQLPDFVLPLGVVDAGYRVVYEPAAVLREPTLTTSADEYRMRVRVALRALWAIHDMRRLLNPLRHGRFAWQLWSHKVLRYSAFVLLLVALLANLRLASSGGVWPWLLALQVAGYLLAALAPLLARWGARLGPLEASHYFALLNVAAGHAALKYLLGRKQVVWTPRKG